MVYLIGGYWNYTFSRIDIIMSDILDYETVKIYFLDGSLAEEYHTKNGKGIESVYSCLKQYIAMQERELPDVFVKNIKVKIFEYKLDVEL